MTLNLTQPSELNLSQGSPTENFKRFKMELLTYFSAMGIDAKPEPQQVNILLSMFPVSLSRVDRR